MEFHFGKISASSGIRTHDVLFDEQMCYQLHHRASISWIHFELLTKFHQTLKIFKINVTNNLKISLQTNIIIFSSQLFIKFGKFISKTWYNLMLEDE